MNIEVVGAGREGKHRKGIKIYQMRCPICSSAIEKGTTDNQWHCHNCGWRDSDNLKETLYDKENT